MIEFECRASAEAYSDGDVLCARHRDMVYRDITENGQPDEKDTVPDSGSL